MTELHLLSCVIFGSGSAHAEFEIGHKLRVLLTEDETAEIREIIFGAFERNRAALAESILSAARPLLSPPTPDIEDAEFTDA